MANQVIIKSRDVDFQSTARLFIVGTAFSKTVLLLS